MKVLRPLDFVTLNVYYFGLSFMWNSLGRFVLQALVLQPHLAGSVNAEAAFGVLSFLGLLIAMIVQPIAGAISDRHVSRWGRRRPFIIAGTLADLIFLAALAIAPNYWALVAAYCLLQFSANIAHGPYQGLLPDLVPVEKRGVASGIKQFIDTFGIIPAALVTAALIANPAADVTTNVHALIAVVAFVLVGTMLINVLAVRELPAWRGAALPSWTWRDRIQSASAGAAQFLRVYPDFARLIAARLVMLGALALLSNYAQFYFAKVLFASLDLDAAIKAAVQLQSDLLTIAIVTLLGVTLLVGPLSDRYGRRIFNVAGGLIAAVGASGLLFVHNEPWLVLPFGVISDLLAAGGLIGIGMGMFTSANWAWAVDLTPPDQAARFLGLTNIATAGATVVTALFGPAISWLNAQEAGRGFTLMFVVAILGFVGGAVMLGRVKEKTEE